MLEQDKKTKQMIEDKKVIESIRKKNLELENEKINNEKIKKEQDDAKIAKNTLIDHENISFSPENHHAYKSNNEIYKEELSELDFDLVEDGE